MQATAILSERVRTALYPDALRFAAHLIAAHALGDLVLRIKIGSTGSVTTLPLNRPQAARRFISICEFAAGIYLPHCEPDPTLLKEVENVAGFRDVVFGLGATPLERMRIYKVIANHVLAFNKLHEGHLRDIADAAIDNGGLLAGKALYAALGPLEFDVSSLEALWRWFVGSLLYDPRSQTPFHERLPKKERLRHFRFHCHMQEIAPGVRSGTRLTSEQRRLYGSNVREFL